MPETRGQVKASRTDRRDRTTTEARRPTRQIGMSLLRSVGITRPGRDPVESGASSRSEVMLVPWFTSWPFIACKRIPLT